MVWPTWETLAELRTGFVETSRRWPGNPDGLYEVTNYRCPLPRHRGPNPLRSACHRQLGRFVAGTEAVGTQAAAADLVVRVVSELFWRRLLVQNCCADLQNQSGCE